MKSKFNILNLKIQCDAFQSLYQIYVLYSKGKLIQQYYKSIFQRYQKRKMNIPINLATYDDFHYYTIVIY